MPTSHLSVVDISGESGDMCDPADVLLAVQNGLIQMCDAPPLGDVEAEECGQLSCRCLGGGVAPRAEGHKEVIVGIKREIAVHHARDADRTKGGQIKTVTRADILLQCGVTRLDTRVDILKGIGKISIFVLVFPFKAAGGNGDIALVDEARLDPR